MKAASLYRFFYIITIIATAQLTQAELNNSLTPTEKAAKYKEGVNYGRVEDQIRLAECYDQGSGVPLDYTEASKWYLRAAKQGSVSAQMSTAERYKSGKGYKNDPVASYMWFNIAAVTGNELAQKQRGLIESSLTPEQISQAQQLATNWKPKSIPSFTDLIDDIIRKASEEDLFLDIRQTTGCAERELRSIAFSDNNQELIGAIELFNPDNNTDSAYYRRVYAYCRTAHIDALISRLRLLLDRLKTASIKPELAEYTKFITKNIQSLIIKLNELRDKPEIQRWKEAKI